MKSFYVAVFLFGLAGISCAEVMHPQVGGVSTPIGSSAKAVEDDVLELINQYRRAKNLPGLTLNQAITEESRKHSYNMANNIVPFSHDGFSNRSKALTARIPGLKSVAENVAYGQKSAQEVVTDWIKSPGHKMNIEGNYTQTGIGIIADKKGVLYYTQMFVR